MKTLLISLALAAGLAGCASADRDVVRCQSGHTVVNHHMYSTPSENSVHTKEIMREEVTTACKGRHYGD